MRLIVCFLLFSFSAHIACGQKFLQLERVHSPKTKKYFPGHEITFQMNNGQWYTRVIDDISYEQNLLIFVKDHAHLDSITAFRTYDRQRWSRPLSTQLFNFAAVWTLYVVVDQLVSDNPFQEMDPFTYTTPLTSAGTGLALRKFFKKRTFSLAKNARGEAKKWRLRVLDLDVKNK